jgi:hypothetical protein
MLELLEKRSVMSDDELERALLSISEEIDKFFVSFKECERIILTERESLAQIAALAEQLKSDFPAMSDCCELVEEICRLSGIRL